MFVQTKTRSGRTASQYNFKSLVSNKLKQNANEATSVKAVKLKNKENVANRANQRDDVKKSTGRILRKDKDTKQGIRKSANTTVHDKNVSGGKSDLVAGKSVYVICETNVNTRRKRNVAVKEGENKKSAPLPTCVITYDAAVEEAIKNLSSADTSLSVVDADKIVTRPKRKLNNVLAQKQNKTQMRNKKLVKDKNEANKDVEKINHVNSNLRQEVNENKIENENKHVNRRKKTQKNAPTTKDKNDNLKTKTPSKRLRFRKKYDYNEITLTNIERNSLNSPVVGEVNRQPIYRKNLMSPPKPVRGKRDVYEFKEDVNKSVSEGEFEKGTASFIKDLEKRFNDNNKKALKNKKNNLKVNKQSASKKAQAVTLKQNAGRNKQALNKLDREKRTCKQNIDKDKPVIDTNKITKDTNNKNYQKDTIFRKEQMHPNEIEFVVRRSSLSSNNTPLSSSSNYGSPASLEMFNSPLHVSSPSEPKKSTPIKIMSNILISSPDTPFNDSINFNFRKPNANSTMFIQRSPWRPTLGLKTNPLFITTKKSSLPIYNQEMVINSKMVEQSYSTPLKKHEDTIVEVDSSVKKKTKQDSILNYINSSIPIETTQEDNRFNYSLFDADQLSPVKKHPSPRKNVLKESNILPMKKTSPVKNLSFIRVDDNTENKSLAFNDENLPPSPFIGNNRSSSPKKALSLIDDNVSSSFSFLGGEKVTPTKQAKPSRFSMNEVKRVIFGGAKLKKNKEKNEEPLPVNSEIVELNKTENIAEVPENTEVPVVGLFEDFEMEKVAPKVTYARLKGRAKRQRNVSINDEIEDETVEHTRKKRKDVRTKEEELEAEKWAAKLNEMFNEVDKYQLEVE